jgi:UDP-glucose 4-epimerase
MRVLLICGNGFLGSHVQDTFLGAGMDVSVFDPAPERFRPPNSKVEYCAGNRTAESLIEHVGTRTDAIVYLASTTVPATSVCDPVGDVATNLFPFLSWLDVACRRRIGRFVFVSSGGTVYGVPARVPVSETHRTEPVVSHGIVKLMMERYLVSAAHDSGLQAVVLRVGNAYGERQDPFGDFGAIATFLGCYARDRPIVVWGDGEIVRDYVYAGDVASACLAAVLSRTAGGVYNIGTAQGCSLNELLDRLPAVTCRPSPPIQRTAARRFDVPKVILANALARTELGWEPKAALDDGLRITWEWVRGLRE